MFSLSYDCHWVDQSPLFDGLLVLLLVHFDSQRPSVSTHSLFQELSTTASFSNCALPTEKDKPLSNNSRNQEPDSTILEWRSH